MKYQLHKLSCDKHLARNIEDSMDNGWELHGPTFTVKEQKHIWYCQAMTLKEDHDKC